MFVDYEQGLVSLRDADAAAHTYSYTCRCFTEKLHPYFCPSNNEGGENSAPLIICPVNQAGWTNNFSYTSAKELLCSPLFVSGEGFVGRIYNY